MCGHLNRDFHTLISFYLHNSAVSCRLRPYFKAEETEAQVPWQVDGAVKLNSRSCLWVPGPLLLLHYFCL